MGNCTSSAAIPTADQLPHNYPSNGSKQYNNHGSDSSAFTGTNNASSNRGNPTMNGSLMVTTTPSSSSSLGNGTYPNGGGGGGGGKGDTKGSIILSSSSALHHHKDDHHSTSVAEKLANLGFSSIKRNSSGNNIKSYSQTSSNHSSTVSLISLQSGHTVDLRSLPELPPALFLAAIFNDVAFFKAIPIVEKATILAARKAHLNLIQQLTTTNTNTNAGNNTGSVSTTKPQVDTVTTTSTTTSTSTDTPSSTTEPLPSISITGSTTTVPSSSTITDISNTGNNNNNNNNGLLRITNPSSSLASSTTSSSSKKDTNDNTSENTTNTNTTNSSSTLSNVPKRNSTSIPIPSTPSVVSPSPGPSLADLVNACDKHGDTIVQLAAAAGSKDVLEILLTIYPRALKQLKPGNHNSLLHYATLGPVHIAEYIKAVRAHVLHNPDLCTNSLEESAAAVAINDGLALVDGHPSATADVSHNHVSPPIIISNGTTTTINVDSHHNGTVPRSNSGSMLAQMGLVSSSSSNNNLHHHPNLPSNIHMNHSATTNNLSSASLSTLTNSNSTGSVPSASLGSPSTNNVHVVLHGNHTSISDLAIERPGLTHGAGTYLAVQGISIPSLIPGLPSYPHPEPVHALPSSLHTHNTHGTTTNSGSMVLNRNSSLIGLSTIPVHSNGNTSTKISPNPSTLQQHTTANGNLPPLHRTPSAFMTNTTTGSGPTTNPNGSGILLHRSESSKEPINSNVVHPGAVTRSTSAYMQHHVDDPLYITGFAYLKALMAYTRRWENSHDVLNVIGGARINSGSSSPTSNTNENIGADFLDGTTSPRETNYQSTFGSISTRFLNRSSTLSSSTNNNNKYNHNSLINSHHNHPSSGNLGSNTPDSSEEGNSPRRSVTNQSSSISVTALGKALAREADIREIGIVTVDQGGNSSSAASTNSNPSTNGRSSPDSHYHYHFHQPYTTHHTDAECHGYELGVLDIGHGEEGVIPYLDPSFRIKEDVNNFPVRTRFPSRRTDLTVELLLAHGVIYNVKNSYLKTPWDTAYMHSQQVLPEAGVMSTGATGNCISGDILRDPPWSILFDPSPVSWDNVCAALQDAPTNVTLNPNHHHHHHHHHHHLHHPSSTIIGNNNTNGSTFVHGHSSLAIASSRNNVAVSMPTTATTSKSMNTATNSNISSSITDITDITNAPVVTSGPTNTNTNDNANDNKIDVLIPPIVSTTDSHPGETNLSSSKTVTVTETLTVKE